LASKYAFGNQLIENAVQAPRINPLAKKKEMGTQMRWPGREKRIRRVDILRSFWQKIVSDSPAPGKS
jgi:UDP-N-acetylglucosamine enolpyruvyl transferase